MFKIGRKNSEINKNLEMDYNSEKKASPENDKYSDLDQITNEKKVFRFEGNSFKKNR